VKADIVERLESVLGELEYLPLPSCAVGAALLDALEGMDRIRRVVAMKTQVPNSLRKMGLADRVSQPLYESLTHTRVKHDEPKSKRRRCQTL
jgi:hypothetical protein